MKESLNDAIEATFYKKQEKTRSFLCTENAKTHFLVLDQKMADLKVHLVKI